MGAKGFDRADEGFEGIARFLRQPRKYSLRDNNRQLRLRFGCLVEKRHSTIHSPSGEWIESKKMGKALDFVLGSELDYLLRLVSGCLLLGQTTDEIIKSN